MRERPILFSGPMVRAILDGRKSQTRRVIKPQPGYVMLGPRPRRGDAAVWEWTEDRICGVPLISQRCPYGAPGDRLWMREAWRPFMEGCRSGVQFRVDGREKSIIGKAAFEAICAIIAKSGGHIRVPYAKPELQSERWRPSIHMPRWASRITLEVTRVRIERVQQLSASDAMAEGAIPSGYDPCDIADDARDRFHDLWDDINAKRGYGWAENPWVWALDFRRVDDGGASCD